MMPPLEEGRATADALLQLHSLLLDAVRHRRGGDPHQVPVTVAEIYQELVPYRHVRAALGLELNADYEHTLLRLLAGEAHLARLEPEAAREQLAHELDSANPNVALYRKFAACDVWLLQPAATAAPAWLEAHLADDPARSGAERSEADTFDLEEMVSEDVREPVEEPPAPPPAPRGGRTFTVAEDVAVDDLDEPLTRALGPAAAPEAPGAPAPEGADVAPPARHGRCTFCDSPLPRGRVARYCPYCGADQLQRPCSACGEPVEPGWAFCVACGEPAEAAGA